MKNEKHLCTKEIKDLYDCLTDKPNKVLNIFNDFFGESRVDIQNCLSLDDFYTWLDSVTTGRFCDNNMLKLNDIEWSKCKNTLFGTIDKNIQRKILTNPLVLKSIGNTKFNSIIILVHFPSVKVTNENNRFVNINNLWTKIKINFEGILEGKFLLNRSEYTISHLQSNYMFSHVSRIPLNNFTEFQLPCTGNGPINGTIASLNREYDKELWELFCLELSKYVTVESLAGRPYHYLENLGTDNMSSDNGEFEVCQRLNFSFKAIDDIKLTKFVRYFINQKKLKFNYINGSYSIGMPYADYMILISNEFIKWYNDKFNNKEVCNSYAALKNSAILVECIIKNKKIYYESHTRNIGAYHQYIGKKVCTFKGKDITINISDFNEIEKSKNKSVILNPSISLWILTLILKILNYRYGRTKAIYEKGRLGTELRYF